MAFYPAHCDNICKGCEKNKAGWCIWKDRGVGGVTTAIEAINENETKSFKITSNEHFKQIW